MGVAAEQAHVRQEIARHGFGARSSLVTDSFEDLDV